MSIKNSVNHLKYKNFLSNINCKLVLAYGPAGTGKTMLATQQAINDLKKNKIEKIVITRPLISADEDIGFLPGKMEEKMDPWTRPILDVFMENYTKIQIENLMIRNKLEIAPLSFMRGRTFKNSFIIGDELQNTTINQMKMLLTRIGENSKLVGTGDLEQNDLGKKTSGLEHFLGLVRDDKNIGIVKMDRQDIRRSEIVELVLNIYDTEKNEIDLNNNEFKKINE